MPQFVVLFSADASQEAGKKPTAEELKQFTPVADYSEKLTKDGKLIWYDALHPTSKGARVNVSASGSATVTKGPFKEACGGYAIMTAKSLDDAINTIKGGPMRPGSGFEVREIVDWEEAPIPEEYKVKARELKKIQRENATKSAKK